ncbi:MAG TPA: XdhC family protein [Chitinophagaceae bacterium]|nr:XdhC family protein [Chitinophagaceae bacterium]
MKKQLKTWELILESHRKKIPVMLLYVLESSGSSPGRQGFFMAVNEQGEMEGSIGGGIMEHKFVEMAKEKLKDPGWGSLATDVKKQIHDKSAPKNQSGMICSGEQTILLYAPHEKDIGQIKALKASLSKRRNGTLTLSPGSIHFSDTIPAKDFHFIQEKEDQWEYIEKTGYKNKLTIIGGGHCALALSDLMSSTDFYISVFDDRKGLKTMQENGSAHEKHIIDNFAALENIIVAGPGHYVVIMTFGYRTDDEALRAILKKEFAYLGLLGSRAKIEKMFATYRNEGVPEDQLAHIHTPIGIPIKSQTPEEIAISIAAEIIKVKNGKL